MDPEPARIAPQAPTKQGVAVSPVLHVQSVVNRASKIFASSRFIKHQENAQRRGIHVDVMTMVIHSVHVVGGLEPRVLAHRHRQATPLMVVLIKKHFVVGREPIFVCVIHLNLLQSPAATLARQANTKTRKVITYAKSAARVLPVLK